MLNWLRYFPIKFRNKYGPVCPQGPNLKKLKHQAWYLGDSTVSIKVPKMGRLFDSDFTSIGGESISPGKIDILTMPISGVGRQQMPNRRWQSHCFFKREWFFVGPWFTGSPATLTMRGVLIGQEELDDYASTSFFHPRVFESVLADYLNSHFGHEKIGKKPYNRGPLCWEALPLSKQLNAGRYEIHEISQGTDAPVRETFVSFPISHNRFVNIIFDVGDLVEGHTRVETRYLYELLEKIIATVSVEFGPQMLAEWERVKLEGGDISLANEYGELKWPIKPEDVGKVNSDILSGIEKKMIE